jgi:hypothetical protein
MRPIAALFFCLTASSAIAQNTMELTAQYGPPELESYQVADGVTLTVTYGRDRLACNLLLQPRPGTFTEIPSALVDKLLDQLVSPRDRKGKAQRMFSQSGCATFSNERYENVSFGRVSNECAQPDKVQSLHIQWTRPECASALTPPQQTPPSPPSATRSEEAVPAKE